MVNYLKGDATDPQCEKGVIVHCCNDIGKWGKGFVLALSRRWPETRRRYLAWYRDRCPLTPAKFMLGNVQFVGVEQEPRELVVANLIGQRGIYPKRGVPPIRYGAIEDGFHTVAGWAESKGWSVVMPRMGCGLAGGSWDKMEELILKCFTPNKSLLSCL